MANEALTPDPVDPLRGLVGLSLFPKTIRVCTDVSVDPNDLESVHNFMKPLQVESSKKLPDCSVSDPNIIITSILAEIHENHSFEDVNEDAEIGTVSAGVETVSAVSTQSDLLPEQQLPENEQEKHNYKAGTQQSGKSRNPKSLKPGRRLTQRLAGREPEAATDLDLGEHALPAVVEKSASLNVCGQELLQHSDPSPETANSDQASLSGEASVDELPPGWKKEIKVTKKARGIRKDPETKIPAKLFEEARAIVDNGAELLNTKCMGIDGDSMKDKEKPKERRPDLGRRKPRFSFKPSTSKPPVISSSTLESLDMDQLEDPVEFFAAAERWEEAEKEMKRLKGIGINEDVNDPPANACRRRPGILNKSVRYKHRFSSIRSENDDAFISSQETLGSDTQAGRNSQLPEEPPGLNVYSPGSVEKTENNGILNELLSSNGGDLNGGMALSKLQEWLQIKPIELGPLCFPEFPMTGKVDGKAFGESIRKPRKFSLEIRDLVKSATEGTASTRRQHEGSPANNLTSTNPPKSPHASLSLLRQKISQSNPLRDPFSPLNIDLYNSDSQSDHPPGWSMKMNPQCISNSAGPTESHGETENIAGSDYANIMVPLSGSDFTHEQLMKNDSGKENVKTGPNGSQSEEELENGYDIDINTDITLNMRIMDSHYESDVLDKVKDVSVVNEVLKDQQGLETESYISCQKMQDGEVLAETLSSPQAQGEADDTHNCSVETVAVDFGSSEIDGQVDDMPPQRAHSAEQEEHFEDSAKDVTSDQLSSVAVEVHSTEVRSKLPDMSPLHHAKAKDKQPKAKRPAGGRRESKALRSRPSLADAGTSFQDGVRRSKRMKTRPLEYWKGERLLYGRVNDSLKLVGVKYISPGKGSVKVESFISDDYKVLVELAARY